MLRGVTLVVLCCVSCLTSSISTNTQCIHIDTNFNKEISSKRSLMPKVFINSRPSIVKNYFSLFDNDLKTCVQLFRDHNHHVEVHFLELVAISRISLSFADFVHRPFNVSLKNKQNSKTILCQRKVGYTAMKTVDFLCQLSKEYFNQVNLEFPKLAERVEICDMNVTLIKENICCDGPLEPPNGYRSVVYMDRKIKYSFSCHDGYKLNGPDTIVCHQNGSWTSDTPTCFPVTEELVQIVQTRQVFNDMTQHCDPLILNVSTTNGQVKFMSKRQRVGSRAVLHCAEGFRPAGGNETECWPNGIWSHVGNFEFKCKMVECPNVYWIPNGFVKLPEADRGMDRFTIGSAISVHCNEQYLNANHRQNLTILRFCGYSGNWVKEGDVKNKYITSDLSEVCTSKEENEMSLIKAYVIGGLVAACSCLILTGTIWCICYFYRRRKRRPPLPRRSISRVPTFPRVIPSTSIRMHPIEHEYNTVIYEEPNYCWNNMNDSVSSYHVPHDALEDSGSLSRNSLSCQDSLYSDPVDAKINNTENEIYE